MAGYPYDTGSSFVRDPGRYAHDAFGHTGDDDRGVRDACFRKIPHTGIDISSKTPSTDKARQRQTPVVSPIYGTIVKAGFDKEAGNYHIIKHDIYDEWWIGGHHSKFEKTSGHVERGELIARMGDTGGAAGVHTHWTVATSLAAALAYVGGWIQYRNGRSVAAWAKAAVRGTDQRIYGLVDPWPLIEREWAVQTRWLAKQKAAADQAAENNEEAKAAAQARKEEEEMSAAAEDIKNAMRRENRPRLIERASTGEFMQMSQKVGYRKMLTRAEAELRVDKPDQTLTGEEWQRHPRVDDETWFRIIADCDEALERIAQAVAKQLNR